MLASSCLRSFDADTPITMADGSTTPIDEVKVGDRVLTSDPVTGAMSVQVVDRVWIHSDELVTAKIGDRLVVTTPDHPFWNHTRRAWMGLEDFQPGETTLNQNGIPEPFGGIQPDTGHQAAAFNLSVTNTHTFYANHTLVHNCGVASKSDLTLGGPNQKAGVGLVNGNIDAPGVREMVNEAGGAYGCHTCGAVDPGTPSGNWIPDHRPPTGLVSLGTQQTAFPHCGLCARRQGGVVSQIVQRANRDGSGSF